MRRLVKCRFPEPGGKRVNLSGETLSAAADFVWAFDTGNAPNPEALRVLRDALQGVLAGKDPKEVFPNQTPQGQRGNHHERDLVVAGYIEWRRRAHVEAGTKKPLEDAKDEAAKAFPWGVSGRDGARNAWKKHGKLVSGWSPQVLEGMVSLFKCN